jgi:hypothetical protein
MPNLPSEYNDIDRIPLTYKHAILFFIAGVVWSWVIL